MAYKLLGMAVWKGAKVFLRRKYGATHAPRPVLAGLVLALGLGATYALTRRDSD